jgi:hypothetical protein
MPKVLNVTKQLFGNSAYKLCGTTGCLKWFNELHPSAENWTFCREEFHSLRIKEILLLYVKDKSSFAKRMGKILKHFNLKLLETNEPNVIAIKLNDDFRKNYMFGMLTALIKTAAKYEKFPDEFDFENMTWTKPAFNIIYKNYKKNKHIFKNKINKFNSRNNWSDHFWYKTEEECLRKLIKKEFLTSG